MARYIAEPMATECPGGDGSQLHGFPRNVIVYSAGNSSGCSMVFDGQYELILLTINFNLSSGQGTIRPWKLYGQTANIDVG